jgi:hypothetical protein
MLRHLSSEWSGGVLRNNQNGSYGFMPKHEFLIIPMPLYAELTSSCLEPAPDGLFAIEGRELLRARPTVERWQYDNEAESHLVEHVGLDSLDIYRLVSASS